MSLYHFEATVPQIFQSFKVFDIIKMVTPAGQPLVLHLYGRREDQHISELIAFILDILLYIMVYTLTTSNSLGLCL